MPKALKKEPLLPANNVIDDNKHFIKKEKVIQKDPLKRKFIKLENDADSSSDNVQADLLSNRTPPDSQENKVKSCHDTKVMKMYECYDCGYRSAFKGCLKQHVLTHKNVKKSRKTKDYSKLLFKCTLCNYVTNNSVNLSSHEVIHKPDKVCWNVTCDIW
ncbi:uncharacterized protein LOC132704390 [Cylas formicarius]|uniref:uncharacterized protein LOC132704390 n=1 Tax=Cylas formicarius TaxID=197179 RepID=UPI002958CFC0|nr:uncharacterized protein LOC132704390 [Cylas formicarius]